MSRTSPGHHSRPSRPASVEESTHRDAELAQQARQRQLVADRSGCGSARRPRRDGLTRRSGSRTTTTWTPAFEILGHLAQHLAPTVLGGEHLEDQVGRDIEITGRERPFRDPLITVEADIRPADRVRPALGDHARIIAQDVAEVVVVGIIARDTADFIANLSVSSCRAAASPRSSLERALPDSQDPADGRTPRPCTAPANQSPWADPPSVGTFTCTSPSYFRAAP